MVNHGLGQVERHQNAVLEHNVLCKLNEEVAVEGVMRLPFEVGSKVGVLQLHEEHVLDLGVVTNLTQQRVSLCRCERQRGAVADQWAEFEAILVKKVLQHLHHELLDALGERRVS
jgi:hypothetical protein